MNEAPDSGPIVEDDYVSTFLQHPHRWRRGPTESLLSVPIVFRSHLCVVFRGLEGVVRCEPGECTSHRNPHNGRKFLFHPTHRDKVERKRVGQERQKCQREFLFGESDKYKMTIQMAQHRMTPRFDSYIHSNTDGRWRTRRSPCGAGTFSPASCSWWS